MRYDQREIRRALDAEKIDPAVREIEKAVAEMQKRPEFAEAIARSEIGMLYGDGVGRPLGIIRP